MMRTDQYQVRSVTSEAEFHALEPVWNSILRQQGERNAFVSFEWMSTWWQCLKRGKELLLLVVEDGEETVAIAPLMRAKRTVPGIRVPFKEVRFISTIHTADSAASFVGTLDFLIAPGHEGAREALVWYLLTKLRKFNCVRLHPIPEDSPTVRVFDEAGKRLGVAVTVEKVIENACLKITDDWDTYYQKRKGKLRASLRRAQRAFDDDGGVECIEFNEPAVLGEAFKCITDVEEQSWKVKGGVPINDVQYNHFYFDLAKSLSQNGWLRIFILKASDKPIAYEYCVDYYGYVIGLKTSYDKSYERLSPGKYMIPTVFEKLFQEGAKEVDMLWGDLEYKKKWGSEVRPRIELSFFNRDPYSRLIRTIMASRLLHGVWDRYWDWRRK